MYKSIVFDLGGVMVDFAPRAYLVDRICNEEKIMSSIGKIIGTCYDTYELFKDCDMSFGML